jgi:hypothetical protein
MQHMAMERPQWDIHPLIGKSRSERLDDVLAMMACERWFSLGNGALDPIVARAANVCGKEPNPVDPATGTVLAKRIKKINRRVSRVRLTLDEWRAYDAVHPAPTFFARPAWGLALERAYYGVAAEPTIFHLPEGDALFPFIRSWGRRFSSVEAMPLGTYTVALTMDGTLASANATSAIVRQLAESCDDFTCTLWPLVPHESLDGWEGAQHQAGVIDLRGGMEAAMSGFKGVARRMAGQALRKGVTVSVERNAVGTYYGLLEESARRWGIGRPHLPRSIFEAVVEFGGDDVEIWIARYRGEAIGGGVMFYGSQEAFFWSAAMSSEFSSLRPSNLLNVEMMKASVDRGMHWYNLGASEGLAGVERFKESLGAQPVDYVTLRRQTEFYRAYRRLRYAVDPRRQTQAVSAATI